MKICNAQGRKDGKYSGYTRVLGNESLGKLISKIQSTVISNGNELERIILSMTNNINNLEKFIDDVTEGKKEDGVFVCTKKVLKSSRYSMPGIEPDLLIFIVQKKRICKVIELKDGDNFDTKKAQGEKEHLEEFSIRFGAQIPFVTDYYICSFNQLNKELIKEGFKNKFSLEHIMTGKELCDTLKISYEEIIQNRKKDMDDNMNYFLDELLKIPEIKRNICHKVNLK